jgi:hypothetical protein
MRRHKGDTAAAEISALGPPEDGSGRLWVFYDSCDDAAHNLELAPIAGWNFCSLRSVRCFESSKIDARCYSRWK